MSTIVSAFPNCCSLPIVSNWPAASQFQQVAQSLPTAYGYEQSVKAIADFKAIITNPGPLAPDYPKQYGRKAAIAVAGPGTCKEIKEALAFAGWLNIINFSSCHPSIKDGTGPPCELWLKHNQDYPIPVTQPPNLELVALQEKFDALQKQYNTLKGIVAKPHKKI